MLFIFYYMHITISTKSFMSRNIRVYITILQIRSCVGENFYSIKWFHRRRKNAFYNRYTIRINCTKIVIFYLREFTDTWNQNQCCLLQQKNKHMRLPVSKPVFCTFTFVHVFLCSNMCCVVTWTSLVIQYLYWG